MSIFENGMFQWLNGGTLVPEENRFAIIAPPHSDFFQDPAGGNGTRSNADRFTIRRCAGDLTLRATVWHDFTAAGDVPVHVDGDGHARPLGQGLFSANLFRRPYGGQRRYKRAFR